MGSSPTIGKPLSFVESVAFHAMESFYGGNPYPRLLCHGKGQGRTQYLGVSIWQVGLSPDKGLLSDKFKRAEGRQLKFLKRAGNYDIFHPLAQQRPWIKVCDW